MNKKGVGVGMIVEMIPTLAVVAIIAVAVFGVSASSYSYDISIRDSEARLLGIGIMKCLASDAVLDLDAIGEDKYDELFDYCGLRSLERVYVGVDVFDSGGKRVAVLSEGDSGLLWVRDLFEKVVLTGNVITGLDSKNVEKIAKYNPGYFDFVEPVFVIKDDSKFEGSVRVEVLINYE